MENFKTQWHNEAEPEKEESNRELPIPQLDPKKMEKFVDHSFQNWGWSSNKQLVKDLERQRQIMQIEERKAKTDHTQTIADSPLFHQSSAIDEKGKEVIQKRV